MVLLLPFVSGSRESRDQSEREKEQRAKSIEYRVDLDLERERDQSEREKEQRAKSIKYRVAI